MKIILKNGKRGLGRGGGGGGGAGKVVESRSVCSIVEELLESQYTQLSDLSLIITSCHDLSGEIHGKTQTLDYNANGMHSSF